MGICKFHKNCPLFNELSTTCTKHQGKGDGEVYCGKYRELDE